MLEYRYPLFAILSVMVWVGAAPAFAAQASVTRTIERAIPMASGETLAIDNLLGRVTIEPANGDPGVVATVRASADSRARAESLARTVRITSSHEASPTQSHEAGPTHLRVEYPLSRYRVYRYTGLLSSGQDNSSSGGGQDIGHGLMTFLRVFWGGSSGSGVEYDNKKVRVISGATGKGVALQVGLTIRLSKNAAIDLDNKVGVVHVRGTTGQTRISLGNGLVSTHKTRGPLDIAADSGDVTIADQKGDTRIATGSGDITVKNVAGAIDTRQGSGDFNGKQLRGALTGRAGSGDFDIRDLAGSLNIRTGSGDVSARRLVSLTGADIRVGSGDITLAGDLSKLSDLSIKTASGDVALKTGRPPAMRLVAKTASGDIDADWPDARSVTSRDGYYEAIYASDNNSGRIATASGDIGLTH